MSHSLKLPPLAYATANLPTDLGEGAVAFDTDTSEHKVYTNSAWSVIKEAGGDEITMPTVAFDSVGNGVLTIADGDIDEFSGFKNDTSLKALIIGTSCTSIGSSAFYYCSGLTGDLVIPNSVTSIANYAFYDCSFTGSLVIPDSVTSIGSGAFRYCNNLTGNLVIPNSVTSIGSLAFSYCNSVTALYVNMSESFWTGVSALFDTPALINIYVHADHVAGYDASWKTAQQTSATVSTWINYPNVP